MCNFLSAIVLKNLDVIWDPGYPDRHEELLKKCNLTDDEKGFYLEKFCRVEFTPTDFNKNLNDINNWRLDVDESSIPSWFNEEIVTNKLWTIISDMFVQDKRETLQNGCFILLDGAEIGEVKNCRIQYMLGNSKITFLRGNSIVKVMRRNSSIGTIEWNSTVWTMYGSSCIGIMEENSEIRIMWDNSKIETMVGSSKIGIMRDSSSLGSVWMGIPV